MRGAATQAAIASGVNQTVRLPRARRPASYSAQLVTRCCCFGMWRRHAALALNGTAGIRVSGKGSSSYTAQLPTPTGRSVQQGGLEHLHALCDQDYKPACIKFGVVIGSLPAGVTRKLRRDHPEW